MECDYEQYQSVFFGILCQTDGVCVDSCTDYFVSVNTLLNRQKGFRLWRHGSARLLSHSETQMVKYCCS